MTDTHDLDFPMDDEAQRISTGSEGLDNILGGGLDPNRMYLYEGSPGSGKTTIALQFLLEGAQGERVLYVTLSETKAELELVAKRHGWSLDGIDVFELVSPETSLDPELELTVLHPAEMELSETTQQVFDRVSENQPDTGDLRQPFGNATAGAKPAALSPAGAGTQALLHHPPLHGDPAR